MRNYLIVVAVFGSAVVAAWFTLWLVPANLQPPALHGYRATRRAASLAKSTVFGALMPILTVLSVHTRRLPFVAWRARVSDLLVRAGEPLGLDVNEFFALVILCGVGGNAVGLFVVGNLGWLPVLLLGALGAYYPTVWLQDAARARLAAVNKGLPYANDLLGLAMHAGLDFLGALRQYVGKVKDSNDPIAQEFQRILQDLELGSTRRAALEAFGARVPTEAVHGFVNAVVQAEQRGTPVSEALRIQAVSLRTHRSLLVEKLANRASVFILLPLGLMLLATILMLFGGMIVRGFRGELLG